MPMNRGSTTVLAIMSCVVCATMGIIYGVNSLKTAPGPAVGVSDASQGAGPDGIGRSPSADAAAGYWVPEGSPPPFESSGTTHQPVKRSVKAGARTGSNYSRVRVKAAASLAGGPGMPSGGAIVGSAPIGEIAVSRASVGSTTVGSGRFAKPK